MTPETVKNLRNFFGGFFTGYAFASFAAGMLFYSMSAPGAPTMPTGEHIYRVHQYGTYFTAAQNATFQLLLLSMAFAIPGFALRPKLASTAATFKETRPLHDDPTGIVRWGALAGVVALGLMLCWPGPWIVWAIAQAGFLLPPP